MKPFGSVVPILTPLNEDETLDERSFRALIDFITPDLDGIFVLGTTGEFPFLRQATAYQAVRTAVEQVAGRVPVYVGVGDTSTGRVLERVAMADESGADFIVACSPYYFAITDPDQLVRHFYTIADASRLPVLIYNIPQNTHVNIPVDVMIDLAAHKNIIGMKDSWGDMFQFQDYVDRLQTEDFIVFQGREELSAFSLWAGAGGIISAIMNIAPRFFHHLMGTMANGDRERSLRIQRDIRALSGMFRHGYWISALKTAAKAQGTLSNTIVASPQPGCSEEDAEAIRDILKSVGVL